ncbi:zinc finger CCCH-type with G patch domain-containing protein [Topomyia yanbarensis]|uniref:zinc finger CCCH-type with G patch domain-containing protein n=1 Tax=Topomyia yanbarensis TaxID=2498891 RepID=UPI00273BDED4|nr:zinc finger CCCH-type with G patch domain-containing protein [Topomyia yanbarensis]
MSSVKELNESIKLYEEQLDQVEKALTTATEQSEREDLANLKNDITELLRLTRETLQHEHGPIETPVKHNIEDEFALFMSEIHELSAGEESPIGDEPKASKPDLFQDLVGSKCSAPHIHRWGSVAHHNALICSLDTSDEDNVMVKVLFINPTHQEMVPCSYYLDDKCKFENGKCRFSHGENVPFNELKDYREPRFELLRKKGGRVLAKQKNRLWSKGTISSADFQKKTCNILLEESKREVELPFEDILPFDDTDEPSLESEDDSSSNEADDDVSVFQNLEIIQRSLLNPVPTQRLGEWEKHTKGIGSKIMMKMGYVVGAGLGSKGEGIVVPVSAQVLPQGRSLDYCMQLREQAKGDGDLFSVEKKLLRQKRIQEKRNTSKYAKGKQRKDVFSFINSEILCNGEKSTSPGGQKQTTQDKLDLPSCSSKNLNIASLKLSEHSRRLETDVQKLKHSLTRHQPGSQMHSCIKKQIADKRSEISQIQATEHTISREQQLRNDKRKMTVF